MNMHMYTEHAAVSHTGVQTHTGLCCVMISTKGVQVHACTTLAYPCPTVNYPS